jgi:hypothetical protein
MKIKDKKVEKTFEWKESSGLMAYYENMVLVDANNSWDKVRSKFSIIDIDKQNGEKLTLEFYNEDNEKLHCIHAQKDYIFFMKNNKFYKTKISEILGKI